MAETWKGKKGWKIGWAVSELNGAGGFHGALGKEKKISLSHVVLSPPPRGRKEKERNGENGLGR